MRWIAALLGLWVGVAQAQDIRSSLAAPVTSDQVAAAVQTAIQGSGFATTSQLNAVQSSIPAPYTDTSARSALSGMYATPAQLTAVQAAIPPAYTDAQARTALSGLYSTPAALSAVQATIPSAYTDSQAAAAAPLKSINGCTGVCTVTPYTSAAAKSDIANVGYILPSAIGAIPSMGGGRAPSTIFVGTVNVVSNSTTDAPCFTTGVGPGPTIPANTTYVGNKFRLLCRGVYSTGVANVSATTIKIKLGSITVATATTSALPVSLSNYEFLVDETCVVRSTGSTSTSGTVMCNGAAYFWTAVAVAPLGVFLTSGLTPVTFDPTIAETFSITSALTSLVGSPSITATSSSVEVLY